MDTKNFFETRGSLTRSKFQLYVKRPADDELFRRIQAGQFCYVLTCRQMGKTSLINRTIDRLKDTETRSIYITLNGFESDLKAEEWYYTLLSECTKELELSVDLDTWWQSCPSHLGYIQRFINFLHEVILTEVGQERVIIFIDEIEEMSKFSFADDFFAGLRAVRESRSKMPQLERLTIVIVGGINLTDLIKSPKRTTFNVAYPIELSELEREGVKRVFRKTLQEVCPGQEDIVLDRIYDWTSGHPYLTQTLTQAVVEKEEGCCTANQVDELVCEKFLSKKADRHDDINILTVNHYIDTIEQEIGEKEQQKLLKLYRQVYENKKKILEDRNSINQDRLIKRLGLVRIDQETGTLVVKNNIYRAVFNKDWIVDNISVDSSRRVIIGLTLLVMFLIGILGYFIYQQYQNPVIRVERAIANFQEANNPQIHLSSLATLFELESYQAQGQQLFDQLTPTEQLDLFAIDTQKDELNTVIKNLYITLENNDHDNALLEAMARAADRVDNETLATKLDQWHEGRVAYDQTKYQSAIDAYTLSIGINDNYLPNPEIYIDRGLAYAALEQIDPSLSDFQKALTLDDDRQEWIWAKIKDNEQLYRAFGQDPDKYPMILASLLPDEIRQRGRLIAGVKQDFRPFGFINDQGEWTGFDIDIVKEFAQRWLGDEKAIELIPVTSNDRIPVLVAGEVDLIAASMTYTEDRARRIDFSQTYFLDGQSLLVCDGESGIDDITDLNGKKVAALQGSTSLENIENEAEKIEIQIKLQPYQTVPEAVQALQEGQVDVFTSDRVVLWEWQEEDRKQQDNCELKVVGGLLSEERYGLGLPRGASAFRDLVNFTLQEMKDDDTYNTLYRHRFGALPPCGKDMVAFISEDAIAGPDFCLDETEVTVADYRECVASSDCSDPDLKRSQTEPNYYADFDDYPVIQVTWDQANAYCEFVGKRLPTGAEWDRATASLGLVSWKGKDTERVKSNENDKTPSGVFDLFSNVREWVDEDADQVSKVIKGGSFGKDRITDEDTPDYKAKPDTPHFDVGFRCASDAITR